MNLHTSRSERFLNTGCEWSAGVSDLDLIDDGDIIALEHVDHLDGARRV